MISGGSDVNPSRYSAEPHPATISWRDERDVSEMALLDAADDIGLPVLGICRGHAADGRHGGRHTAAARSGRHRATTRHSPGPDIYGAVEVRTEPGIAARRHPRRRRRRSPATTTRRSPIIPVSSAVATADDGLLEAMETPGDRFRLGVQWHPETQADRRLFEALAAAAAQWRQDR